MPKSVLSAKAAVAAGALTVYLKPLLAADAKIDLGPALKGVTSANFADRRDLMIKRITEAAHGKLAKDAKLDGLPKVMDAIEEIDAKDEEPEEEEREEEREESREREAKDKRAKDKRAKDKARRARDAAESEKRKFLENTLSEDELATYDAMCAKGADAERDIEEPDEEKEDEEEERPAVDKRAKDKRARDEESDEEKVSKKAMDAAIKEAAAKATADAIAIQRAIRTAEEEVAPIVGKLAMSFDSADAVYKHVLKLRNIDTKDIHPSAYRVLVKNLPAPKRAQGGAIAMDAGGAATFTELFPGAAAPTVI